MKPKAIIFDFDDTLFHLNVDWTGLKRQLQKEFKKKGYENTFVTLYPSLQAGHYYVEQNTTPDEFETFKEKINSIIYTYEIEGYKTGQLLSGSLEILQKAYLENRHVSILSLNSQNVLDTFKNDYSLNDITLIGRENVHNHKPHPEGVEKLLRIWNIAAHEVWGVGNSIDDFGAFTQAGLNRVFIITENINFEIDNRTRILSSLKELQNEF